MQLLSDAVSRTVAAARAFIAGVLIEIMPLIKLVGPYLLGFTVAASAFFFVLVFFAGAPWKVAIFVYPFVIGWGSVAALLGLKSSGGGG